MQKILTNRAEEDLLAKKLFGDKAGFPDGYESSVDENSEQESDQEFDLPDESAAKSVWNDPDDENLVEVPTSRRQMHLRRVTDATNQKLCTKEYEKRLRDVFSRASGSGLVANPKWAEPVKTKKMKMSKTGDSSSDECEEDDLADALCELTASTGKYLAKSTALPKGVINIKRMGNITRGHRTGRRTMNVVQFHPSRPVVMTAGENKILNLFEVGLPDTEEAFLQQISLKKYPISNAMFSGDGRSIFIGSFEKNYLYSYDLMNGKLLQMRAPYELAQKNLGDFSVSMDGKYIAMIAKNEVDIVTAASMEYIGVFTAPVAIACVQFCPMTSSTIYVLCENGQIFVWRISERKVERTFYDDGAVRGTVLRISKNGQFIACGSNTGIVNLYDAATVDGSLYPKPIKTLSNLTTSIDHMTFSSDSQILSISSKVKENATRLIHLRSRSVFSNFPFRYKGVGKVTVTDFSPHNAYMAVGDSKNFLTLFRLLHYDGY